jgi:hypothetical protein
MAGREYYEQLPSAEQPKLEKLRRYLAESDESASLHHRLWALWAASYLPDAISAKQRSALIAEVLAIDPEGEAWSLAALGKLPSDRAAWPVAHAVPGDTLYDGYATALVLLALRRAGIAAVTPKLAKAGGWLVKHKVAEGQGPVMYLNGLRDPKSRDAEEAMKAKFMRDAAAAVAVLALTELEQSP